MKNVMWTVSKRAILAVWIAGAMVAPVLAQDGASFPVTQDDSTEVDEIVVTGVRASLDRALGQKRRADTIVDGISAEDIADFPDSNISESLQRIAGVTITRNNGEGELVSIRGLAPQFTKVTLGGLPVLAVAVSDDGNKGPFNKIVCFFIKKNNI
jgi:outer membrane receptor for ferrienterochelin and colicin